jgi:hypothetical protein
VVVSSKEFGNYPLHTVGKHKTDAEDIHHPKQANDLLTRVGDHAGLTREKAALFDAPAHP